MTVRLFGAVYDFIGPGAGKSNVPLQLAPDGSDPIIEFRCHKLSGPSLHFPDSFFKFVHTRADAGGEIVGRVFEDETVQQHQADGRVVDVQPNAVF